MTLTERLEAAIIEVDELLRLADRAASKLKTAYMRHEVEARCEYDNLIASREAIATLLKTLGEIHDSGTSPSSPLDEALESWRAARSAHADASELLTEAAANVIAVGRDQEIADGLNAARALLEAAAVTPEPK